MITTGLVTTLAGVLVLAALVAPDRPGALTPAAFVRIPAEGLVGLVLVLLLPARPRAVVAALLGAALGLVTIMKVADIGFLTVLDRPFDPLLDWNSLVAGAGFLAQSIGRPGTVAAVGAAILVAVAIPVVMALSVLRLTRVVVRRRAASGYTVAVLGLAWVTSAALGVQIVPGVPVASTSAVGLAYDQVRQARAGLRDGKVFAAQASADAFRDTPGAALLTGLRGKDVLIAFVESYGRVAVEDPQLGPGVDAVLEAGNRRLGAAGFVSRSAFLTSPTFAGGSWLAHSTLQSGVWIDSQQRYDELLTTDRLTLTGAFRRAGWQTVCVAPAVVRDWPEASFYGYDRIYDARGLGYHGPRFSYATMPDQYTLAAFRRAELSKPGHAPRMAELDLVSSHAPWAPLPQLVDWADVGDGSIFDPMPAAGYQPDAVWRDPLRVRTEYGRSVQYSLDALISYVEKYGDDNLVLIFLGDHQPASMVSGQGAGHDVPITIVARDPAVLNRISTWGWQDGLLPGPDAPVWRMDEFRNRFLTAFGPGGAPTPSTPRKASR